MAVIRAPGDPFTSLIGGLFSAAGVFAATQGPSELEASVILLDAKREQPRVGKAKTEDEDEQEWVRKHVHVFGRVAKNRATVYAPLRPRF